MRPSEPIAVIGVSAIMPNAPTAASFWSNITGGRYCVTDVPADRWDSSLYFDPDPAAPDKVGLSSLPTFTTRWVSKPACPGRRRTDWCRCSSMD